MAAWFSCQELSSNLPFAQCDRRAPDHDTKITSRLLKKTQRRTREWGVEIWEYWNLGFKTP